MGRHGRDAAEQAAQEAADAFDIQYGTSQAMSRKEEDPDTRSARLKSALSDHYKERVRYR